MLCTRIRKLRIARRLTQSELASALGISRSAVANWESGDKFPAFAHLGELSTLFGVPFEWLATGRGKPTLDDDCVMALEADIVDDPEERLLLLAYRSCSKADRRSAFAFIASISPKSKRLLR